MFVAQGLLPEQLPYTGIQGLGEPYLERGGDDASLRRPSTLKLEPSFCRVMPPADPIASLRSPSNPYILNLRMLRSSVPLGAEVSGCLVAQGFEDFGLRFL